MLKGVDECLNIPSDTVTINEENRLVLINKINKCEANGAFLDTGVMDQILSLLSCKEVHVFPTYSTIDGTNVPYFGKYAKKEKVAQPTKFILIPLCNGCHFNGYVNGYVINYGKRDSLYRPKCTSRRSMGVNLANQFCSSIDDVKFTSYYKTRVQTDGNSCGAWLIAGMLGYVLNTSEEYRILDRDDAFNVMFVMVEALNVKEKFSKVKQIFKYKLAMPNQV